MKKVLFLCLCFLSVLGFTEPYKDGRGVLFMEVDEWIKFYNLPGENQQICPIIGSVIMEQSYIKDGKKMTNSYEENMEIIREMNRDFAEVGLKDVYGGTDKIHEYFYASLCRKPTEKDYSLVGSPSFKDTMERIFRDFKPRR